MTSVSDFASNHNIANIAHQEHYAWDRHARRWRIKNLKTHSPPDAEVFEDIGTWLRENTKPGSPGCASYRQRRAVEHLVRCHLAHYSS